MWGWFCGENCTIVVPYFIVRLAKVGLQLSDSVNLRNKLSTSSDVIKSFPSKMIWVIRVYGDSYAVLYIHK